jgi:hypothetical protein
LENKNGDSKLVDNRHIDKIPVQSRPIKEWRIETAAKEYTN